MIIEKVNNKKYTAFSQKMFMYKLNLQNLDESNWIGSRITKKKNIKTMQDLRNLKFKNYPFWRFDKFNQQIIKGGWHFSYMQTPDQIFDKIKSFSHGEYNDGTINKRKIEERILNNEDIFGRGIKLKKIDIDPSILVATEKEIIEDLIIAAFSDAKSKINDEVAKKMKEITGGLPLPPGFNLGF